MFAVSCLIVVIVFLATMAPNEPPREALKRLFLNSEATLGQTWLYSGSNFVSTEALHCLVLTSNIPLIVKASTYPALSHGWQDEQSLRAVLENRT
jgi:hypothetical protein